jgi:hypothetical protein
MTQWRGKMQAHSYAREIPMQGRRMLFITAIATLLMAAFAQSARAHDEPVVGSLVGAGIGAAIAGPPGAAVGAVIGAALGSHTAHESDHGAHAKARHRHGHARHEPRYLAPARYAQPARVAHYGNGNGGNAEVLTRCEPEPYAPRIVHRDDRPRVLPIAPVAQKPKMRKVCKYVPVRDVVASR